MIFNSSALNYFHAIKFRSVLSTNFAFLYKISFFKVIALLLDQNIAEFIDQVNSYEIHKSKLNAIKREIEEKQYNKHKVLDERSELLKLRILNNKLKSHEFVENEKINQIRRNNQLLLDRLLDISKGKWAAPGMRARKVKRRAGPKSLNYVTKRKELARIDEENSKLMKRILNQNAMLSTKRLEQEYRERKRLQKSLQRNKLVPIQKLLQQKKTRPHEKSTGRLPPLQNADTPSLSEKKRDHGKFPQTVSSSKQRQTTFEVDDKVDTNQDYGITDDELAKKDPNSKPKFTPTASNKGVPRHVPVILKSLFFKGIKTSS